MREIEEFPKAVPSISCKDAGKQIDFNDLQ
jgi:hypothetical protein